MKRMTIFEPTMCCPTGICGPGVDSNLLRISTVLNNLKNHDVIVERYNLTNNPSVFVDNKEINNMLEEQGIEILPVTMVDGVVVKTKEYPTNEEIASFLEVPLDLLASSPKKELLGGCDPNSGCC